MPGKALLAKFFWQQAAVLLAFTSYYYSAANQENRWALEGYQGVLTSFVTLIVHISSEIKTSIVKLLRYLQFK